MIDKGICIAGNVFVVNDKVSLDNDTWNWGGKKTGNGLNAHKVKNGAGVGSFQIPVGESVEVVKFQQGILYFKYNSEVYYAWWNACRIKLDKIEGQEIVEPAESLRYKIYYLGKPLKPKYFNDMGKIKSSLLIAFGYYRDQYEMFEKYKDRNPELQDNEIPEWYSGSADFTRDQLKDIEIMSFAGKSRVPVKTDFDVTSYYDQSMRLINVTAQFGNAARELFKKNMETKEFSYLLVYAPDEYRDEKNYSTNHGYKYCHFDFTVLKESQKIKDVMKASGVKDTKKCTKYGKTAIVFKTVDDLKKVMLRLEPKEYFILDCDGEQLVEKNTRFVKLIMLQKVRDEEEA
jgi:hypothetical protein